MGHHSAKDVYRTLQGKLDGLSVRLPDHAALRSLLELLYTPEEAELVARMPFGLAKLERVAAVTNRPAALLGPELDGLARKGLVLDLLKEETGERFYMPSPFIIGIFEFTMMRAGPRADHAERSRLFHEYLESGLFYRANFADGQQVFVARALPHEGTVAPGTEVLDPDRVASIIERSDRFAVGVCSCRHEREHQGGRTCAAPLETCTALGTSAEYLIHNNLAREISKSEMRDIVARSRELGLLLCADNVRSGVGFICHCCSCCCNLLRGITEFGYPSTVTTSAYQPQCDAARCSGCGRCEKSCPLGALSGAAMANSKGAKSSESGPQPPTLNGAQCVGCGVCVTRCNRGALSLVVGQRRRILPENSFERVILQSLERGTLQNLVFDNPSSQSQSLMRGLLGGLLRLPPVKRWLVSDAYRSVFLKGLASVSGYDGP